jgi:Tfp pilus assembly protein PilN
MLNDINLIPQAEVTEQRKSKAVKSSTLMFIVLLLISVGVSAFFFIKISGLNSNIKQLDSEIETLRGKIKASSNLEVSARNLDKKYSALNKLFTTRSKYSLLLKEIEARRPDNVEITNFDVKQGQVSISGISGSYISVSNFVNNFLNKEFADGNPDLKDIFIDVSLNSVSLDKGSNSVKFFIVVSYQDGRLQGL